MTHPHERQIVVMTEDGVRLVAWVATPSTRPLATLVLCHGLTTDASEHGAFPALRNLALREGMAVVRFDFRSHGRSGGTNEKLRLAGLRADAEAIVALAEREVGPEAPVIPVGLSFAGAPAVHAAATGNPCAGLVLGYAVVDYYWNYSRESPVRFTKQMRAAAQAQVDPPWAEMPVLGTDYFLPKAMVGEMRNDSTFSQLSRLTIPVLAYHGSRDTFVGVQPIQYLASTHAHVELRIARGAGHGFLLWRPRVVRGTVAWATWAARRFAQRQREHILTR